MKITESVFQLDSARGSHVYLIRGGAPDTGNILIDSGMPGLAVKILAEIKSLGTPPDSIGTILLTHHDVDHIGNAKKLQEATGAVLWAPEEDLPYITGEKSRPGIKRLIGAVAHPPVPVIRNTYSTGQTFGCVRALHAPGHTPGHTIFQYQDVVFAGDLFTYRNGRFGLTPGLMTWNPEKVKKSMSLLKTLDYKWLCPSHGDPVRKSSALDEFLAQF